MRKIKVKFVDYWDKHHLEEDVIYKWLNSNYIVELTDNPDYLFYSCFGHEHLNYECVRVFYTAENLAPNFNECDYAISFERMEFGDRNLQFPNFLKYTKEIELISRTDYVLEDRRLLDRDFCSFVVSNGNAASMRSTFFDKLSEYKMVSSGGGYKNNIGKRIDNKLEFQNNYKFAIAFENSTHIGYTTEKILQAFASRTVPIYWGDPLVVDYFNPNAFINISDYDSIEDAIEYIKKVDSDDELYLSYLKVKPWKYDLLPKDKMRELDLFLSNIIEQEYKDAYRRNLSGMSIYKEKQILNWIQFENDFAEGKLDIRKDILIKAFKDKIKNKIKNHKQ